MITHTFHIDKNYTDFELKVIQDMLLDSNLLEDLLFGRIMQKNNHDSDELIDSTEFLAKNESLFT